MVTPQQKKEADAQYVLKRLGLDWGTLQGKKILDIGEGSPELRDCAQARGVTVIPLSIEAGDREFPYRDESFDYVISFALFPGAFPDVCVVEAIFKHAQRVLKKGGEFRFGPGNVYFGDEKMSVISDKETDAQKENRMRGIYERSLAFLQTLDKNIEVMAMSGEDPTLFFYHTFISRK